MADPFVIHDDEPLRTLPFQAIEKGMQDRSWFLVITASSVQVISTSRIVVAPKLNNRGKIGFMSAKSRRRLLLTLNQVNWDKVGNSVFVTLTFPDAYFSKINSVRTSYRSQMTRAIEGKVNREVVTIWRQEWQPRKTGTLKGTYVSHYHVILAGVGYLPHAWVKKTWAAVLGATCNVATDVRRVRGAGAVVKYLAKYVCKQHSLDIVPYLNTDCEFGRPWGITRRSSLPMLPRLVCRQIDVDIARELGAVIKSFRPDYEPSKDGGFTALGSYSAGHALSILGEGG